jgi:long-chain fatty acid transport protein
MRFLTQKNIFKLSMLATAVLATQVMAGGFQLYEQDAEGLGTYHAGMAANTDTAAIEFYNPAGMADIKHTMVSMGVTDVALNTYFKGHVGAVLPSEPAEGSGNTNNVIPNAHVVVPFSYKDHPAAFGFGVNTPFGLSSDYPRSSKGNEIGFGGTNTTLETVNIGPSLALALTPKLSIGGGVDFMYGKADYNGEVDLPWPLKSDHYTNHLEGTGWGYNLGLMLTPNSTTHIGFAYRSSVKVKAHGDSIQYNKDNQQTDSSNATATFSIPASYTASLVQKMSPKWSVMGTVMYTQWSVFDTLTLHNVVVVPGSGAENVSVHYDYKNSWMGSVGTKYWINDRNAISFGYGRDQTPTQDYHRDIRLPDGDRWAASFGLEHKFNCKSSISLGYAYIDMGTVKINNTKSGQAPYEIGTSKGHANLVGIQLNYQFS